METYEELRREICRLKYRVYALSAVYDQINHEKADPMQVIEEHLTAESMALRSARAMLSRMKPEAKSA